MTKCIELTADLPVASLLAGDTAKVLAALTGPKPLNTKPPETSVKSEDTRTTGCARMPGCSGPALVRRHRPTPVLVGNPAHKPLKTAKRSPLTGRTAFW